MRIVYRPYVMRAILDATCEAVRLGRAIEKIVLTRDENRQLHIEADAVCLNLKRSPTGRIVLHGVTLEVEQ